MIEKTWQEHLQELRNRVVGGDVKAYGEIVAGPRHIITEDSHGISIFSDDMVFVDVNAVLNAQRSERIKNLREESGIAFKNAIRELESVHLNNVMRVRWLEKRYDYIYRCTGSPSISTPTETQKQARSLAEFVACKIIDKYNKTPPKKIHVDSDLPHLFKRILSDVFLSEETRKRAAVIYVELSRQESDVKSRCEFIGRAIHYLSQTEKFSSVAAYLTVRKVLVAEVEKLKPLLMTQTDQEMRFKYESVVRKFPPKSKIPKRGIKRNRSG
ncbi:MAG: hypothetical protein Q7S22_08225 [Candidatus Micrarchaeota archaeon]|nr:hypothetical protein [Candidatus Micrarchaeota archaeon]